MTLPPRISPFNAPVVPPVTPGPTVATAAAQLSSAEEAQIADAFPPRPQVAQKLYGPGRGVHQPAQIGGRLDLSA